MTRLLFVCLGNICRSPLAQGIFASLIEKSNLLSEFDTDSCGTSQFHTGHAPDYRSQQIALDYGIDISHYKAREIELNDFYNFHYILAMDENNLNYLQSIIPSDSNASIELMMRYSERYTVKNVPDPYYGKYDDFQQIYCMLQDACGSLFSKLKEH